MYGTVHFYLKIKNVQYCTLKNCGAYNVVLKDLQKEQNKK